MWDFHLDYESSELPGPFHAVSVFHSNVALEGSICVSPETQHSSAAAFAICCCISRKSAAVSGHQDRSLPMTAPVWLAAAPGELGLGGLVKFDDGA